MIASARKAFAVIFDPAFRGVLWKSLALTIVLFAALFFGAQYGLSHLPQFHWSWINTLIDWIGSLIVVIALFFLGAPVAALFASLFLDEIAEAVEKTYYPADPPSAGVPFWRGLFAGLRLAFWVILWSLVLLPFNFWLPGVGTVATIAVNGWLLGREFFELAALRHMSRGAANKLRRRHASGVWAAGLILASLAFVPIVNFFAPLYGAAFMVHLYKRYIHSEERPL
jgi:CysZ protein